MITPGVTKLIDNLQRVDDMVNAYIGVTLSGASKTLDFSNDPTSYTQENGRCKILDFTGSPGATCTVTFPNKKMWYYVLNNTGDANRYYLYYRIRYNLYSNCR
jgi:hypothetical protein